MDGDARGLARAAREGQDALKRMGVQSVGEFNKMARARQTLGVRSEHAIQREIQHTEAAYNRLARSGRLSFEEQRRAARAMQEQVERLNNEMGKLSARQMAVQRAERNAARVRNTLTGVAATAAGVGVVATIAAPKVQKALDYDLRLAHMANTAFAEQGVAGRAGGMRELDRMVVDAVRFGGGTRDSAATAAEQLLGAGIFKPGEIKAILREAVMAGTANNADAGAFAQMAITANQTMGIAPDRAGRIFGMGTFAGQQGGFEIKDMAKWLPQQMAAAKAVGMAGEAGFAKLAALNQAAIVTAGTRDEAGNNVVNLLAKLGSQDTVKDFKKQGVNLPKELAEGRMKGLDAIDVLGNLLQQQLAKDKNYQAVQRQLSTAKNDAERRAALESAGNIAQGTVIGKVFQDRQALMGLYGYVQNRDRVDQIAKGALANPDAAQRNFELISSTPVFKVQQAKNEAEIAQQASMDKLTPAIGSLADATAELVKKYPGYSTAIAAATLALTGLASSAGVAAIAMWLARGGKAAAGAAGAGSAAGAVGAAGAGSAAASTAGRAGGLLRGLGAAGGMASLASGLFFTSQEEIDTLKAAERMQQGYRGRGFDDPRVKSLQDRLTPVADMPLLSQELKGEIVVRVSPAPGVNVQAEARSNSPRIPMRAAVGQTMTGAGF